MLDKLVLERPTFKSLIANDLPSIEREDVIRFKSVARSQPSGTVTLAGKSLRYAWRCCMPLAPTKSVEVWAKLENAKLGLRFERGLLEALFIEDVDLARIDQDTYGLLVEHLLTAWINEFESFHGGTAEVTLDFSPPPGRLSPYSFDLFVEGEDEEPFSVTVFGDFKVLEKYLRRSTESVMVKISKTIPLRATIESALLAIPESELEAVGVGDLLFLDDQTASSGLFNLKVAGKDYGSVRREDGVFRLVEPTSDSDKKRRNPEMNKRSTAQTTGSLNVDVSVEVGQTNMTVGELSGLVEGTVIDLGEISPDEVRLRTNGEIFAHAKLIEVGDGLGLWITKVV